LAGVYKIVVTGPFNSGKTTFIDAISEIDVVSTDRRVTRSTGARKSRTTVAMDFGRISFPDGTVIHLYGTPGQERFGFMWEILSEGMLGYVVLMDGSDPSTFEDGKRIIETFCRMSDAPFVVGITRPDRGECVGPDRLGSWLLPDDEIQVMQCDARRRGDVKLVLLSLMEMVLERADALEAAG